MCHEGMGIEMNRPGVDGLDAVVRALRDWQHERAPMQLHPGDLGWAWRSGTEATAATVRTWSRDDRILAAGMLDGAELLRLTLAPDAMRDDELARRLASDLDDPQRGVLGPGKVGLEVPDGALVKDLLIERGWDLDEPWAPLRRDLSAAVDDPGLRIEEVGPELADARADVQRGAFDNSRFTGDAWHTMAAGSPFADARDLLAFDDRGNAVAAATVWSAGPGRPGLLEPLGVHRAHRGHGYGTAICLAAAAALRELGSSSALVCTPSANVVGVAAYRSAGFEALPERLDLRRNT